MLNNLRVFAVVRLHILNESPPGLPFANVRLPLRTADEGRGAVRRDGGRGATKTPETHGFFSMKY